MGLNNGFKLTLLIIPINYQLQINPIDYTNMFPGFDIDIEEDWLNSAAIIFLNFLTICCESIIISK